jgi:ribosomal protein S18 acetylase RimI-like enzyme
VSLWVDRRARGRGVARALIRAVAGWAHEVGARRVVLFVQEANEPGRALYVRAGFRPTGDREPVGAGRPGFKLVVAAGVDELLDG